jgi:hypothetical protein
MLVEHDVQPELVGDQMLVKITVVEVGADLGILELARDRHPHGFKIVPLRNVRIGHLGEVPGLHGRPSCCSIA